LLLLALAPAVIVGLGSGMSAVLYKRYSALRAAASAAGFDKFYGMISTAVVLPSDALELHVL
jgi:hypothetical protein